MTTLTKKMIIAAARQLDEQPQKPTFFLTSAWMRRVCAELGVKYQKVIEVGCPGQVDAIYKQYEQIKND